MKTKKNKKHILVTMSNFIEKQIFWLSLGIGSMVIIVPLLLFFAKIDCNSYISRGDFLNYFGTIISALVSFIVAIVALSQSKKSEIFQTNREIVSRQRSIKPHIQIVVEKVDENSISIHMTNNGACSATHILLFEHQFLQAIRPYATETITVQRNELELWCADWGKELKFTSNNYPNYLELHYYDIDLNDIYQEFKHAGGGIYETQKEYYAITDDSDYYEED